MGMGIVRWCARGAQKSQVSWVGFISVALMGCFPGSGFNLDADLAACVASMGLSDTELDSNGDGDLDGIELMVLINRCEASGMDVADDEVTDVKIIDMTFPGADDSDDSDDSDGSTDSDLDENEEEDFIESSDGTFRRAQYGTNVCPDGWAHIQDESRCAEANEVLELFSSFQGIVHPEAGTPQGCYADNMHRRVYMPPSSHGAVSHMAPICEVSGDESILTEVVYSTGVFGVVAADKERFNKAFRSDNSTGILRRECDDCAESHQDMYFKRKTAPQDFDAYTYMLVTWSNQNNTLHDDFDIYSSLEDAVADRNPWTFCNYNDTNIGFPRDCGPTGYVAHQWNSFTHGATRDSVRYSVVFDSAISEMEDEIVDVDAEDENELEIDDQEQTNLVENGSFDEGMNGWAEYEHGPRMNGLHTHNFGANGKTAHLHGHCHYGTAGGMVQAIETVAGAFYRLNFDAYSGNWDGQDIDSVEVTAGDLAETIDVAAEHSVNEGNPERALAVSLTFVATDATTDLTFWAGPNNCIDIDNVVVVESEEEQDDMDDFFRCDTSINFIPQLSYSQISLTDGCHQSGGETVCDANPIYDDVTDAELALEFCQVRCLENDNCTGFFFQRHQNGHEICGFYTSDFELSGVRHGHADGSQVCKRREMDQPEDETDEEELVADGQQWTRCAVEHGGPVDGVCTCDGTVRYGKNDTWFYQEVTGTVGCNNGVFGDPLQGTVKECQCLATVDTSPIAPVSTVDNRVGELLENGSFEFPMLNTHSWRPLQSIPGWSLAFGPAIEVQNQVAGSPFDGEQLLELNSHAPSGIYQDVETVPGVKYKLRFAFSARPGVAMAYNEMQVLFGDTEAAYLSAEGSGLSDTAWQYFTFTVTAESTVTRIAFNQTGLGGSLGSYVDAVSLMVDGSTTSRCAANPDWKMLDAGFYYGTLNGQCADRTVAECTQGAASPNTSGSALSSVLENCNEQSQWLYPAIDDYRCGECVVVAVNQSGQEKIIERAGYVSMGCDGVANSGAVIDECGVCGGDSSCLDCHDVPHGGAVNDDCGVCGGDGTSCRTFTSCLDWLTFKPDAESGTYSITPEGGQEMTVECDMESDGGGWTLITQSDFEDTECPGDWERADVQSCWRGHNGASTASFSTQSVMWSEARFSMSIASYNTNDGFGWRDRSNWTIDQSYVDGVSMSVESDQGREHLFTYAIGFPGRRSGNIACPENGGAKPQEFVGDAYTCDANEHRHNPERLFEDEWFMAQAPGASKRDIEIRLMGDEGVNNENGLIYDLIIYVR